LVDTTMHVWDLPAHTVQNDARRPHIVTKRIVYAVKERHPSG